MKKSDRRAFAIVGLGGRHAMYRDAVTAKYADSSQLVAVCDLNAGRIKADIDALATKNIAVRGYHADDFDRMIAETKPDCVIVTTIDAMHDKYICRAMELGCDVITEKPMTMDEVRCRRILDTRRKTGRTCTVTFNYRYAPARTQVKDLLMSGVIGNVLGVDFHWMLDVHHGADYFRRWHRNKTNSGGLLVHKATHHFDLVNWWLSDIPETVSATGRRAFYTPETAKRYGLGKRGKRCLDCPEAVRCRFRLNLRDGGELQRIYLSNESHDGYFRDQCVFNLERGKTPDLSTDIEDDVGATVTYRNGTILTYSLTAYSPWEGSVVSFRGTRGRLELVMGETSYVNADGSIPGELVKAGSSVRIFPHWGNPFAPALWTAKGGHGGADPVMLDYIFSPGKQEPDKYLRAADQRSGAYSILCGVAAKKSILERRPVCIDELAQNIGMPDYAPMPAPADPLPMPPHEKKQKKIP